jgi:hypothetical protein
MPLVQLFERPNLPPDAAADQLSVGGEHVTCSVRRHHTRMALPGLKKAVANVLQGYGRRRAAVLNR